MERYINADKMIADTEAMRQISEAITIDGIIKYINEHATSDAEVEKITLENEIAKLNAELEKYKTAESFRKENELNDFERRYDGWGGK